MKATITISLDNAAFDGDNLGFELARMLIDLAGRIERYPNITEDQSWAIIDTNGNKVGTFEIVEID